MFKFIGTFRKISNDEFSYYVHGFVVATEYQRWSVYVDAVYGFVHWRAQRRDVYFAIRSHSVQPMRVRRFCNNNNYYYCINNNYYYYYLNNNHITTYNQIHEKLFWSLTLTEF